MKIYFIIITECDGGKYGPVCSLACGACINSTKCHHINGSCLQGCGPGFKGQKCDKGLWSPIRLCIILRYQKH